MNLSELFECDFNKYSEKFEKYLKKSIDDAIEEDIKDALRDEGLISELLDELYLVDEYFDGAVSANIDFLQERLKDINDYQDQLDSEELRSYSRNKISDEAVMNIKISNMFSSLRQ